jgi:hypothetical protein
LKAFSICNASVPFGPLRKDVYDLDIITERIALSELLENLQAKHEKYCREEHKCLFDQFFADN